MLAEDEIVFRPDTFYAAKGTPENIDGIMDEAYLKAPVIKVNGGVPRDSQRRTRNDVSLRILWDENYLYAFFDIVDPYITPAEHEKQWTQDYTALYQFYLGDSIGLYINTSGKVSTDYRNEPGVVGCSMYNVAVNHGLNGNKPYAAAGRVACDGSKLLSAEEQAAAKAVADACWYQTTIVKDDSGKATGWTCEMKIKFESFTPKADDVIGFVGQVDCDDKAAEKGNAGSGNWGTREYSLFTNSEANSQNQRECYKDTRFFDQLVLALEPDTSTEEPTTEEPTTEAPTTEAPTTEAPTSEAPTSEEPSKPGTTAPGTDAPAANDAGCASSVSGLLLLTPMLAGAVLLKKKKKSE